MLILNINKNDISSYNDIIYSLMGLRKHKKIVIRSANCNKDSEPLFTECDIFPDLFNFF